jgi:YD repeat-containing protein
LLAANQIRSVIFPVLLSLLWNCDPCSALVDLKNANYSDAWVDIRIGSNPVMWRLERGYNSRTLHNGYFGFGWCSDFEHALQFLPNGTLRFTSCGAGSEIVFKRVMTPSELKTSRYIAEGVGEIEFRGGHYFLSLRASSCSDCSPDDAQEFDGLGRLLRTSSGMRDYIYRYAGSYLKSVSIGNNIQISFEYYSTGKIRRARASSGEFSEYWYSDSGDLIKARAASGNTYSYYYDNLHNLTRIDFPDGEFKTMAYNTEKDWITEFRDVDGCVERYRYETSVEEPVDHYWAEVDRNCPDGAYHTFKYEFWYGSVDGGGRKHLMRSLQELDADVIDNRYNERGYVVSVVRNGIARTFQYDRRTDERRLESVTNLLVPSVKVLQSKTPLELEMDSIKADLLSRRTDQIEISIQKAESLSQSADDFEKVNLLAAQIYEDREDSSRAELLYRKVLEGQPDNVAALSGLARILAAHNSQLDEAESLASRAARLEPLDASSLQSLGWALFRKGRAMEAEAYLRKANTLLPTMPLFHEHLGDVFACEGKTEQAIDQWSISRAQLDGDVRSDEEESVLKRVNKKLSHQSQEDCANAVGFSGHKF